MPSPVSSAMSRTKAASAAGSETKINVAIIGAGISGLAVANGLLNDPAQRFDVQLYEQDTIAYDLERGGYQLRIALTGLNALKSVSNEQTWSELQKMWGGDDATAPAMVNPDDFGICLDLARVKVYPKSRPIPRTGLRHALLQRPLAEGRTHFSHVFERYELAAHDAGGVTLHFEGRKPAHADLVIAADGSRSRVNEQVGLRNKVKLKGWALVQARGPITAQQCSTLPQSLRDSGSVVYLGGPALAGFASVYNHREVLGPEVQETEDQQPDHTLFWSVMIPASKGQPMLDGDNDPDRILPLLIDYVRNDLKMGDALPHIYDMARDNLRTGLATSSFKPTSDWRGSKPENSRIILIGDAIHPMTPGRGMGANQALCDAGNLVKVLLDSELKDSAPRDEELSRIVRGFDREMYSRAFVMVEKSQQMTDLDLSSAWTRAMVTVAEGVLTVIGWVVSGLELVGLKSPKVFDFELPKRA